MDLTPLERLESALARMGPDDDLVKVDASDLRDLIDAHRRDVIDAAVLVANGATPSEAVEWALEAPMT